jgi:hypothetical protein
VLVTCLTLTIPRALWLTSNRQIANRGYRQRIVADLQQIAADAAHAAGMKPIAEPVALDWTIRYPKGVRTDKGDATNAQPTTKALLDGLVAVDLLVDDGPLHVVAETFRRGSNLDRAGDHEITLWLVAQGVPF